VAKGAWRVTGATAVLRELSAEGKIYLQDDASQLVAHVVDVQPGERVLDLCAAPGGKTTLMADRAGDWALIVAADRSAPRIETIVATMHLHELDNIKPVLLDAAEQLPFWNGSFDKVLVDAPCSGTGTLRRNPEIRWRLKPADIPALAEQQKRILGRAIKMVKPGGRLVYSTCSVEREENEEVVAELGLHSVETIRTWPQRKGSDGFFMTVFERRD
jgi:16S rRNA (cytosine967-C5)-methyltransferase